MVPLEHSTHCLITCPMSQSIWTCICVVWVSIAGFEKLLFNGFFQILNLCVLPHFQIVFHFLMYWGLWHVWHMCNAFVFEAQFGVQKHIRQFKVWLFCEFSLLPVLNMWVGKAIFAFWLGLITWLLRVYMILIEIPRLSVFELSVVVSHILWYDSMYEKNLSYDDAG